MNFGGVFSLAALFLSILWLSSNADGESLIRGSSNNPSSRSRNLSNTTNDQAHNITKTGGNIEICKKKNETVDCGIWNSVFHHETNNFDCQQYTFAQAYDICKSVDRHDYCGCAEDSDLLEWVSHFLEERRKKNWVRYKGRPYPGPIPEGSGKLQFALCIKDDDPEGLLCRDCEYWNLEHMAGVCNATDAIEEYCGCGENAIGEYLDAQVWLKEEAKKKRPGGARGG